MKKVMAVLALVCLAVGVNYAYAANGELTVDGATYLATQAGNVIMGNTVAGTGRVGIGTTNPQKKLHIYDSGTVYMLVESASSGGEIRFKGTSGHYIVGENPILFKTTGPDRLDFETFSTLRMRIDGLTGNVGIGTTNPQSTFMVNGAAMFESEIDNGTSLGNKTITWGSGNKQKLILGANSTISFANPVGAGNVILKLTHGNGGAWTASWPASVKWKGGTAPTLSATAGSIDIVAFYFDGANYYGSAMTGF